MKKPRLQGIISMEHFTHSSAAMGKHYHGHNPCIDPLSMAELMIRLENRRLNSLPTQKPCNPVARILANILHLFR